ncbi:hypothetical protein [Streptomyces humi]|uniref:hypothetical protein n=1 Tax=Streptomyces humi TaxID=1428620 RepID=UPI00069B36AA|nr:hypothetical protein [Streptomyces humi]
MTGTVPVTDGTTNGSTARIVRAVADAWRENGLTGGTRPAGSVTAVTPYDAAVVRRSRHGFPGRRHRTAGRSRSAPRSSSSGAGSLGRREQTDVVQDLYLGTPGAPRARYVREELDLLVLPGGAVGFREAEVR